MFGFALDTGEPFGLPAGTVRGLIALTFTGLVVYQFATTGTATSELLATAGPYLGFYFAGRQADSAAKATVEAAAAVASAPVPPPFIPDQIDKVD